MKPLLAALLLAAPVAAAAQQQEIQRALIQRDQQSAEFAARLRGQDVRPLEDLHARQLRDALAPANPDPGVAQALAPYEREQMARERGQAQLRFSSPIFQEGPEAKHPAPRQPLPLPGGLQPGVDAVPADGLGR